MQGELSFVILTNEGEDVGVVGGAFILIIFCCITGEHASYSQPKVGSEDVHKHRTSYIHGLESDRETNKNHNNTHINQDPISHKAVKQKMLLKEIYRLAKFLQRTNQTQ